MIFDYFRSVSSRGERMTKDKISRWPDHMVCLLNEIGEGNGELKRRLPAVAWQASFAEGRRKNECAVPSGLVMVDVDHVDNPFKVWSEQVAAHREALGIVAAHMTPSRRGLRIVAECDPRFGSLSECQAHIAEVCGLEIDTCTKDWARLSFLVPMEYFYFLDEGIFEREPKCTYINVDFNDNGNSNEKNIDSDRKDTADLSAQRSAQHVDMDNVHEDEARTQDSLRQSPEGVSEPHPAHDVLGAGGVDCCVSSDTDGMHYKGIPYAEIIARWFSANGGEPVEGERNVKLYRLALSLRYICDFDAERVYKVMPRYGLKADEVRALIKSAMGANRGGRIPADMGKVLAELGVSNHAPASATQGGEPWGASGEPFADEWDDDEGARDEVKAFVPVCPPVMRDFVNLSPEAFKSAMIVATLPVLGTLLTRLRAEYIDGEEHAPNFTVVVEAPQASGKSFTRNMVRVLMRPIVEKDQMERVKEQQFMAQKALLKNSKKQPEEPEVIIRSVPASISIAKLLKRLDKARGLHLFTFLEELDTLTKSNHAGAWSQKSDIYRNAFDNAEYGQDYMSDNSYSANVNVFYNMLMCGTPRAVSRFYADPEDGLVSRVLFCRLPDQFGETMPVWQRMTQTTTDLVNSALTEMMDLTYNADGTVKEQTHVDMRWIYGEVHDWLEEKRIDALKTQDRALDIFRRRSSVIAFRAAMVVYWLWTRNIKKSRGLAFAKTRSKVFYRWIAEYTLKAQVEKYGRVLNQESEASAAAPQQRQTRMSGLYDSLPAEFTTMELACECRKQQIYSQTHLIIYRWKNNNLIEKIDKNRFKKI